MEDAYAESSGKDELGTNVRKKLKIIKGTLNAWDLAAPF